MSSMATSSQSCFIQLIIDEKTFDGKTGKDKGHAEMTALDSIIGYVAKNENTPPAKR